MSNKTSSNNLFFQSNALDKFKDLLKHVQPEIQEIKSNDMWVFQWKGEQVGLFNTYSNAVQLIIFSKRGVRKEIEYDYMHGEEINWRQIELRVKILMQQLTGL